MVGEQSGDNKRKTLTRPKVTFTAEGLGGGGHAEEGEMKKVNELTASDKTNKNSSTLLNVFIQALI